MKKYNTFHLLSLSLLIGSVFAFYTVVLDFKTFYLFEGTVFKIDDCLIPNPVTTPCFWGAWGFLIALLWSVKILKYELTKKLKHLKFLILFLMAGNIFAWTNFLIILNRYLSADKQPVIGCSSQLMTNPFSTPCFIGSAIFLVALLLATSIFIPKNQQLKNQG